MRPFKGEGILPKFLAKNARAALHGWGVPVQKVVAANTFRNPGNEPGCAFVVMGKMVRQPRRWHGMSRAWEVAVWQDFCCRGRFVEGEPPLLAALANSASRGGSPSTNLP